MIREVRDTVAKLTTNIKDLRSKPALRPVLEAELLKMNYAQEEVAEVLDDTFKVTLQ